MKNSLIRLDGKYISTVQLQMPEDQIWSAPPLSLIEPYLRDVRFLHLARMGRGCKLDPTHVNALVEIWRPETRFRFPCEGCTITLEDVQLQLRLPVDGPIGIGSVVAADWRDVCEQLLMRVLDKIFGARIDMNWLKRNIVELNAESREVEREQHARAYIFRIIEGLLMLDKSRNLVHLRWLLKFVDFREMSRHSWRKTRLVRCAFLLSPK
ncbi:hypothetical protein PVK06_023479 [Gossypium arboreum]|uniref:Aminotransferase-like plant mobile domain-containing protein n=1 Tax=Gossypium arboreum TaxID=29729 RepID=A0ABR0PBC1_GOSAR|nr:hypothetical protein PVK06_023479 [Gossypium arboreum]